MNATSGNFFDQSRETLVQVLAEVGHPRYRADQVWAWAYRRRVDSFEAMSNLPISLRRDLAARYTLNPATVAATETDDAGTRKDLLRFADGEAVETVLMSEMRGYTACLSTQVGCPMACTICATGRMGLRRDLSAGEVTFQAVHFARQLDRRQPPAVLRNIVFMGMGEPLLNYDATVGAIARLCDPYGMSMSARLLTVSTVGLPKAILALARQPYPVGLAVSLHGTTQETRERLVPVAARVPLPELMAACEEYARVRGERITFEYVLVKGVNDSAGDAERLVSLIGAIPAHVNLIPLNPVEGCDLRPADAKAIQHFRDRLSRSRIPCTVRLSRGVAIGAGCGQLRGSVGQ